MKPFQNHSITWQVVFLLAFSILLLKPDSAHAGKYYYSWIGNWPSKYGANSGTQGPFGSMSDCESDASETISNARHQGAKVTITRSCYSTHDSTSDEESDSSSSQRKYQSDYQESQKKKIEQEKRRKEEFDKGKNELLHELKGHGASGPQGLRDAVGDTGLALKPTPSESQLKNLSLLKNLHCSAYWAIEAADAALIGGEENNDRAKSLGQRSSTAMNTQSAEDCPNVNFSIPEPGLPEENAQVKLFRLIQAETMKTIASLEDARQNKAAALKKDKIYTNVVSKSQLELKRLDSLQQTPEVKEKKQKEKKSLKEALALLKDATTLYDQAKADEAQAQKDIKTYKEVFDHVNKNPENASEYLKILKSGN